MRCYSRFANRSLFVLVCCGWIAFPSIARGAVPTVTNISADVVSLSDPFSSTVTFAVYGSGLSDLLYGTQQFQLNGVTGSVTSGDDSGVTVSFVLTPRLTPTGFYALSVIENGSTVYTSEPIVRVINIFSTIPERRSIQNLLDRYHKKKISKRRVGLNVHYALGSTAEEDAVLGRRLVGSQTKWMREHFSHEVMMGEDQAAWLKRYDKAMSFAVENNIRVVGLLAYGRAGDDYSVPNEEEWEEFVDFTVNRYKHVVDVWEVWNEPDSKDYLEPPLPSVYVPMLRQASRIIRRTDPESIILAGGLSQPDADWARRLLRKAPLAFDDLAVHVYACEQFLETGGLVALDQNLMELAEVVRQYRPKVELWFTEIGCSMGSSGVDEAAQRRGLKRVVNHILNTGFAEVILLYTIRDRSFLESTDPYEAYFGLLDADFQPKRAWVWYRKIRLNPR